MQIRAIVKYPVNLLKKSWLGEFAQIVRIAFTPLGKGTDSFVQRRSSMSVQEAKQGIIGVITPKDVRNMKKRFFQRNFRT